jgi:hypothetical protein
MSNELISTKIRHRIQELSAEYYSRLQVIETKARQLLEYSQAGGHISFTPHGLSHISAVERNYDWLLSESDLATFNASEFFCLICATFFHDALMIPRRPGDESAAREHHIERAQDFLQKHRDLLGLSIHEVDAISQVIRGHGVYLLDQIPDQVVLGNELVDLRKLGACLSLADISHADTSRAPEVVFRHLEMEEESAFHWRRHLQISGITRKGDALIMSALTFSESGRTAVEDYRKALEQQLAIVRPYFQTVLEPISRVELIQRRLESRLDQTLQFQTNTPAILRLLIEGVYDREDVFIRELVQNSLDSCLVRRAKLLRRNMNYSPRILLTIFHQGKNFVALRVDDNGIGMDISDVQDTVLWIGNSISTKEDITALLQQTLGKNLIATFGIGLLSCFKASSSVTVRTFKESETPLEFKLTGVSDSINPEKASDSSVGTTIIVELARDKIGQIDPDDAIEYYFRMVQQADLEVLHLEWDPMFVGHTREELFRIALTEASTAESDRYIPKKGLISHSIKGEDFSGKLWLPDSELGKVVGTDGYVDILNEGIFVTRDLTTDWFPEQVYFCEAVLNFSSRSLSLPAGRDRVIRDERFKSRIKELEDKSYGLVTVLVDQTQSREDEQREFAALMLAHMYDQANTSSRQRMLRHLDNYAVCTFRRDDRITLRELRDESVKPIYIHYSKGRWVSDLSMVDGKQLYHKEDDFVELQAAMLAQENCQVVSTARHDGEKKTLEAKLVMEYLKVANVGCIDLVETNVIEGKQRSKPVPGSVRQEVGAQTKFVEVTGIPNKRSWRVGDELWINLANPAMKRVYDALQGGALDPIKLRLASHLFDLLAYRYDLGITTIIGWLDEHEF